MERINYKNGFPGERTEKITHSYRLFISNCLEPVWFFEVVCIFKFFIYIILRPQFLFPVSLFPTSFLPQIHSSSVSLQKASGLPGILSKHGISRFNRYITSYQSQMRQPSRRKRAPKAGKGVRDRPHSHW